MNKQVNSLLKNKKKIENAIDTLCDPVRQTLSPKGANVLYQDDRGNPNVSNDGATIARSISVEDPIEQAIIDIVRSASYATNAEAGDGSTGTILFSGVFVKEGLRLLENGYNNIEVRDAFNGFADEIVARLEKMKVTVKKDQDLYYIAKVSSSGDEEIAKNVVKTIKTAGEDGLVFIEPSKTRETEIVEDTGFNIGAGLFSPELRSTNNGFAATYVDVPVLITDKRLYYMQEAETILDTCLKNGYKEVVIVAKDFIGEALPFFITNHSKGVIRVMLIKDPNVEKSNGATLEDLAVYLGGSVVSEKAGSIVDNLQISDFCIAKKSFADAVKTILSRDIMETNKPLDLRVAALKKEAKKFGNDEKNPELVSIKARIAAMTNGIVTLRIGGDTPVSTNEKIHKYEDAVNAVRASMKHGYLVGGGISVLKAFQALKYSGDYARVFRKVAEAHVRQIAENCNVHPDNMIDGIASLSVDNPSIGYNALTGRYEDLLVAGVIDPFKVVEMSIRNSASVAGAIISSGFMITNIIEKDK